MESVLDSLFFARTKKPRPVAPPGLEAGKLVGDFRLVALIGQGGMGQVWEARQLSLGGRRVALKFVHPERVTPRQLEYFRREARAGGRLSHPAIVAVHAHGEDQGLAWIAMEFVEGCCTLRDSIDELSKSAALPAGYDAEVARLVAEIADAMQAAHDAGVIHRDLKPQNVLVTPDSRPKVSDFGLAKLTDESALSQTGDFAGTYSYMSPEQVAARRAGIDHRTDVFSLGATLYELLTLRRAFDGESSLEVTRKILFESPPDPRKIRPEIPEALSAICLRALEKRPEDRYPSMREMAQDLRRFLGQRSSAPVRDRRRRLRPAARARLRAGTVLCAVMVVVLVGILTLRGWERPGADSRSTTVGPHPFTTSEGFAQRAAIAQERIREARAAREELERAEAADAALQRFRALSIPTVSIGELRSLSEILAQISEISAFAPFVEPLAEAKFQQRGLQVDVHLAHPIAAPDLLGLILHGFESSIVWRIEKGTLVVRGAAERSQTHVQRVHNVEDMVRPYTWRRGTSGVTRHLTSVDDLSVLVRENIRPGSWGHQGVVIEPFPQRLLILHEGRVQLEVEEFLARQRELIYTSEVGPLVAWSARSSAARVRDASVLESLQRVPARGLPLPGAAMPAPELVGMIEHWIGRDVVPTFEFLELCESQSARAVQIDPRMTDAISTLDETCASFGSDCDWTPVHGVLLLGPHVQSTLARRDVRLYPVWDLLEEEILSSDALDSLVRGIDAHSYDRDPRNSITITEAAILVVSQVPEVHEQIAQLLSELRR